MGPLPSLVGLTLWEASAVLARDVTRTPWRIRSWRGDLCVFSDDEANPKRLNLDVEMPDIELGYQGRIVAVSFG